MEQKPQKTRSPVKTGHRVISRGRRCAQGGSLTAPLEGAIRMRPSADVQVARGRVEVVETYFDAEGRPIARESLGAARVARAYDAMGNQVEEAYFNAAGKPTVREDLGAARIAWRYDESGNRVEAALYGADGARIRRKRGAPGKQQAGGA